MAKPKVPKKISDDTSVTPVAASATASAEEQGNGSALNKTESKKARKPAIVKTEARPNLVPINLEEEIRRLAYLMAESRGFEPGHESDDWLAAEREVLQRYHQHSA